MDALPFLPFDQIERKPPAGDFTANIVAELRLSIARSGRNPDQYLDQLDHFERLHHSLITVLSDGEHEEADEIVAAYTGKSLRFFHTN